MAKLFLIDEDVAAAILNYLADRPYREVFEFVKALQGLHPLPQRVELPSSETPEEPDPELG
jgi:hypothetical protein